MPNVLTAAIGRHGQQPCAPLAQVDGGQPLLGDQPVTFCPGRLQPFDHDGAPWAAVLDCQPINPYFQKPEADDREPGAVVSRVGAVQERLQGLAQLGPSRLAGRLQRAPEVSAQLGHLVHGLASDGGASRAPPRTRPTTRRACVRLTRLSPA